MRKEAVNGNKTLRIGITGNRPAESLEPASKRTSGSSGSRRTLASG